MSLPRYGVYKDSGVEWLGEVPAHWTVSAIKWLSPVLRGASPRPIDDTKYFDDEGEYAWVRIADASASDGVLLETTQRLSELGSSLSVRLEPGTLFVSIAGTVGKPCITGIKACIHDGFVYFPRLAIDQRFLYRLFESGACYAGLGKMGTQLNLNTDTIGSIRIAVPPSDELQNLLSFLDRETGKIDALIAEQEKLLTLLAEKRQATISHAVTRGLNPNAPMKDSGVPWLGEVPVHWKLPPLYLRYTIELGKMLDTNKITGEYLTPYLRNVDVQWDRINTEDLPVMDIAPNETDRFTVRTGDLLVCEGGEVGRAAVVSNLIAQVGYQKALHRLRQLAGDEFPRYLFYVFSWAAATGVFAGEGQSTIAHLTGEQLRKYRFPKPPFEEQQAIANALDDQSRSMDSLQVEATDMITLLKERRSALIAAAVTGKIDVRQAG